MSQEERDELNWLKQARDGSITQRDAAERIGVSDRWVRKLLQRMARRRDGVVVHGLRGRPSNRRLSAATQRQALSILKQPEWHDFGPTFAAEQLARRHQIHVGKETLRGWMIGAGLGKSKAQARLEVHGWRATPKDLLSWREQSRAFDQIAAFVDDAFNLTGTDRPEHISGARVSANLPALLGVTPILGRTFTPGEDTEGNDRVVLLGYGLWQRHFGGDPRLYEAAVVAIAQFRNCGFTENAPGPMTHLTVAIKQPGTIHEVQWGKIEAWPQGDGRSPAEQVVKVRLRELRRG